MNARILLTELMAILAIQSSGLAQNTRFQSFSFDTGFEIVHGVNVQTQSVIGEPITGLMKSPTYALASGFLMHSPGQITLGVPNSPVGLPTVFVLMQNYPNPFNPATTIIYQIPKRVHVILKVYNVIGQEVALLVNEIKEPGLYPVRWNARESSGIYFYRLQAGEYVETKKMVLLK